MYTVCQHPPVFFKRDFLLTFLDEKGVDMKRFNFVFMLMMLCANQSNAACNAETGKDDDGDYCGSWDCGAEGSNVTCTLSKGTLTIAGEGDMRDYTHSFYGNEDTYPRFNTSDAPWAGKMVTKAVVEGNITRIGTHAFAGERYLTEISGLESVTSLGKGAFTRVGLTSIDIPNVVEITDSDGRLAGAFHRARDLQYINMRADIKFKDDLFGGYDGAFVEVPAINGNMNNCTIANGYMTCGSCGEKFVQAGVGCVDKCYKDYMPCSGYCCLRTRYTLPEADEATSDDNENTIEWIFE